MINFKFEDVKIGNFIKITCIIDPIGSKFESIYGKIVSKSENFSFEVRYFKNSVEIRSTPYTVKVMDNDPSYLIELLDIDDIEFRLLIA
jgi:hypothetical protein